MARNVEIKAKLSESEFLAVRDRSISIAAEGPDTIHQKDTYFNTREGRLKLREFADGSAELIAYRRPDTTGPKTSTYHRIDCPSPSELVFGLTSVLGVRDVVEKRRELFMIGQTRIHLDEVAGLGKFLELEVVLEESETTEFGQSVANEILEKLGVAESQLISGSYVDLSHDLRGN